MTEQELEEKITQLKYQFDEGFGRAVGRREKEMLAHTFDPDNKESLFLAEEFMTHLSQKGFELSDKRNGPRVEIWADLSFNYPG